MFESAWAVLTTFGALWEAEIAQGRLASAGIPARIDQGGNIGLFGPGFTGKSVRGITVLVPTERIAEARVALDLGE